MGIGHLRIRQDLGDLDKTRFGHIAEQFDIRVKRNPGQFKSAVVIMAGFASVELVAFMTLGAFMHLPGFVNQHRPGIFSGNRQRLSTAQQQKCNQSGYQDYEERQQQ
jgi:hypothetical protein